MRETTNIKRLVFLLILVMTYSIQLFAQNKVQGTVVDSSTGEPLIGVAISVEGTTQGTITDIDGRFSIAASQGATLKVAYMGYITQSLKMGAQSTIQIKLVEDTQLLDEVVVVGYGVQKKSDVTGSVTSINKDRLGKLPVTNVLQAVQGAAAGITITQTSSIPGDAPDALVRGKNSINASTGPYIVVDGIPISKSGGTLNDINPNDIESMEILKDASATAIYGTNGANGVILITTKRGKSGKPTIRYAGYVGIEDFSHKLKFGSGQQMIDRYAEAARINNTSLWNNTPVRNEYEYDNYLAGKEIDWIDEISRTGVIQDHNVSIAGGAENVKYYISADFLDQKGIIKGFDYKRYSIRTNIDVDVTKYMKVGTNSYIVSHNNDGGRASLLMAEAMSPYGRMYYRTYAGDDSYTENGSYEIYPMAQEKLFTNPLMRTTTNPERRNWNVNINGYAELDFGKILKGLDGLKYKFNGGYTYSPKRTNEYDGESVNNLTGWARIYNEESQTYTIENIFSYARDFNKHHIDFTGLYAASRKKWQNSKAEASVFINDSQEWNNIGSAQTQSVGSQTTLYTTLSQMGRLNYSFDSRYLFTFTVRRDGSSVFGDNNKYGVFPSVAAGWNVTNESFMKSTEDILSSLKLRLSYGKAGNEAIGVYQTLAKMDNGMLAMGGASNTALYPNDMMGNSNLSWETTKSFNVGLDFGLLKNGRITGNIDFYSSTTTDLLLKRNLPKISGFNSMYANMGKTANKGIEITLSSRNIVTKDFTWTTNLVYSWNKNEIKDLYGDKKSDLGNRWFIGQPIGVIYDYTMVGVWQEKEIANGDHLKWDPQAKAGDIKLADISGPDGVPDGKIDDNDRKILGQTSPKWIGGLTNTFTYKDFSLSVFIQTVQGLKKNNSMIGIAGDEMGRRNIASEIGYWTPENQSNKWRSLSNTSNRYGYGFPSDASFTRIKDITLSYNLPTSATSKLGISALTVYMSGRNLATITDWIGWDPEARQVARGNSSWDSTRGETVYDTSNYPMTKSVVFGLNLTF